jgi:hypothetical protein
METTITLLQQREMLTNAIAQFKAEGKEIELHNTECALSTFDEAKPTGLKYKDSDGNVYETFSWAYTSHTGGKRWQHAHKYENEWGVLTNNVSKSRCFK